MFFTTLMYNHLLDLLPLGIELAREMGPPDPRTNQGKQMEDSPPTRLAPFFRVLSWCARRGAVAAVGIFPLAELYDAQDRHVHIRRPDFEHSHSSLDVSGHGHHHGRSQ